MGCQLALKLHRLVVRHQPAGMEDVEDSHGKDHHGAVERNEVPFGRDQVSVPALGQLDGSVDTPNVDADDGEDHGSEQGVDGTGGMAEQSMLDTAADEVGGADNEDGDGEHLEDDAGNHDVRAGCGVAVDLVGLGGGDTTADGLNDEGDNVAGAEDPEVEIGAEDGGLAT